MATVAAEACGYGSKRGTDAGSMFQAPGEKVPLSGRVALITGASRGIGQAMAEHLAIDCGMKVVVAARSEDSLAAVVAGIKVGTA